MKTLGGGITGLVRRRIFFKYILATILIGVAMNTLILAFYYQQRQAEQTGEVAAEIATISNRVAGPAAALAQRGEAADARELLSVFAAFYYVICADLYTANTDTPAASWPVVGCSRIKKLGRTLDVPLPIVGKDARMHVRIDPDKLAMDLLYEFLVLVALGVAGGLALTFAGVAAFLWFINRPLSLMLGAIEKFERFGDPQKVDYRAEDEIGKVVASYNMMLDREVERVSEIREAHKAILDSVTYATRIQQGLLPTQEQVSEAFSEAAVLWQPRDLVGGDIYWVFSSGERTTVALLDCTGHGVPGGFMTMLAIATIERIFTENESLTPGAILTMLSDLTRGLLNQDTEEASSNDGMDAAICQIDSGTGKATFAGARLSLLVLKEGKVERIKGDKISLGYPDTPKSPRFTERTFPVDANSTLFLMSDGMTDQIGGKKRIAFGYRQAMRLIETHATQSLEEILNALEERLNDYARNEPRLDDLTAVAFRPRVTSGA
ncbi:SpoIIE family protein phosphatase [Stappia sp. GBMRC 2046]|uniref:SpoIIE family protein phosphatase n=1 Tax=Stappia sediminis TaxID=2692190 RepID=A0A7X3S7S0_9HYPH|nr:SpoIIE family protein phosphatase [Stappia sediminis]MXN65083.1 SpoIIE family protein phosphatase [Stappia sediminis]